MEAKIIHKWETHAIRNVEDIPSSINEILDRNLDLRK